MVSQLKFAANVSFALLVVAMVYASNAPAWADSPPMLNKKTDPEILKLYLRKCNGMIAQNKATAEIYATKAQLLEWLKDYNSAINFYSKALSMEPNNTVRLLCRARCYRKRDQYKEALSDYSKAIELGNKSSAAFTGRALSRLLLVQYKEAISDANKAIALNPTEGLAWYVRGSSEAHLGEFEKSLQSLNNAIQINPADSESLKKRSQVYEKLRDESKSKIQTCENSPSQLNKNSKPEILKMYLRKCNGIIAQNKANAGVYATKGQLLEWLKDYTSAVNAYSAAIKRSPYKALFYVCRGRNFRKMKKFEKAESDFDKAISYGNRTCEAYSGRAICRLIHDRYKEALSDAKTAISIDPKENLAWYTKGSAEAYLGLLNASIKSLSRAIELKPSDVEALRRRSRVYRKLGYESKANSDLVLARQLSK